MKSIKTVGVVGAGTMGSALAQKFAQEGFNVILHDREMKFLDRGMEGIQTTLRQGVERKIFSETEAHDIVKRVKPTEEIEDLKECDLVLEAIFEDSRAKEDLLSRLSKILDPDTIIATNTSSFLVSDLARSVAHPNRFVGLHYFYHAAKNRLVEIIPGAMTSEETVQIAQHFAVLTGKDAIRCHDRNGFAVNRFFVPWLNEAARLLDEGVASAATIDAVCMKAFSIGMGPFALMNATGVPIAYHSQQTLEALGQFYTVSKLLKKQAMRNQPWEIEATPETIDASVETTIRERMLGAVFFVCGEILQEGVCSATELNRGARIGLAWRKGPIQLTQSLGKAEVERLVRSIAHQYDSSTPSGLSHAFETLQYVSLQKAGSNAIITFERPEDLNALNEDVFAQLESCFDRAEKDRECDAILLTGTGKAFVAGADIGFFVKNIKAGSIEKIVSFTKYAQSVLDRIEHSHKLVIALLNGMALGGGLELALSASRIYAVPGVQVAFPETGIGIYPGLGGTQRTQRRVGKGLTKYLIYTGEMMSAVDAESMGLIDAVISWDEYFGVLAGGNVRSLPTKPHTNADKWNAVNAFFEQNPVEQLLTGTQPAPALSQDAIDRFKKRIRQKAPLALRTAEQLVNDARGCASELEQLPTIFESNDALLGLSSVGKKVTFAGN